MVNGIYFIFSIGICEHDKIVKCKYNKLYSYNIFDIAFK